MAAMAPEQAPRMDVLMYKHMLLSLVSKKNDAGMGIIMMAISADLDNNFLSLKQANSVNYKFICE